MTPALSPPYGVLALGFSSTETSTIESFFRIAAQRPPGWRLAQSAADAAVVLLNAPSRQAVDECRAVLSPDHRVIMIGDSDFETDWPHLPRPIRMMVTLTKLGELVAQTQQASSVSSAAMKTQPHDSATLPNFDPLEYARTKLQAPANSAHIEAVQAVAKPVRVHDLVLLVGNDDLAVPFLHNHLRGRGYEVQLARSGEEALALVASYDFKLVFLDVMLAGQDGYQTCRAIKRYKSKKDKAPAVIMLTNRASAIVKVRGIVAGSDGYLAKPLNEPQLATVLAKFESPKPAPR